jgi:hypothetical protein
MSRIGRWLAAAALVACGLAVPSGAAAGVVIEHGNALPAIPDGHEIVGLALADASVYVGLRSTPVTADTPTVLYRTATDGLAGWSPVVDPDTGESLSSPLIAAEGARIVVAGPESADTACADYRVIESGAARSFTSCESPVVAHGSGLIAWKDGNGVWTVDDADGTPLTTVPERPFLEGNHAWWFTYGKVRGVSVPDGQSLPSRTIPGGCTPSLFGGVSGGYALLPCTYENRAAVVDVDGDLPPWPLDGTHWSIGSGFAVQTASLDGVPALRVVDLGQGKTERWFERSSPRFAIDHGPEPRLVVQVSPSSLEIVDLGTLAPRSPGTEDVLAPSIEVSGPPALVAGAAGETELRWFWSGSDPQHGDALTYEWRIGSRSAGEPLVWSEPKVGFALTSFFVSGHPGAFQCFEVRARDWAGNASAWGGVPCTYVDGSAPVSAITNPLRVGNPPLDQLGSTPVVLRFAASDDDQVASYDVASRRALAGQGWVSLATRRTTSTSISQQVPAGTQQCFRVRATDRAGNVGDFGYNEWCVTMPYDDRSFRIHGHTKRIRVPGALGHTVTKLRFHDGSMTRKGVRGRSVWVRVIGGPRDLCLQVTLGRRHPQGCWLVRVPGAVWQEYRFRPGSQGTLRIRGSLRVDAVAVRP